METMRHLFQCRCGALSGEMAAPQRALRATCYCTDCQAWAHLLGQAPQVLDPLGGTDVVVTPARHVRLLTGAQQLGCVSLYPRGILRWYARCCDTPIANTPRQWKLPYVGLVHTCLRQPEPLERSFPRVQMVVNARTARGTPPVRNSLAGMARFGAMVLRLGAARFTGSYRQTAFFDPQGQPVAQVRVAPRDQVEQARRAAAAA